MAMKNTIRCCISCILPCGALDVIRIVHANGKVEEISGSVKACEVMRAHPKHVLKKPTTSSSAEDEGVLPKIVIVPPDAELKRGKIYFLIPLPSPALSPSEKKKKPSGNRSRSAVKKKRQAKGNAEFGGGGVSVEDIGVSDRYLSEILSEKISTQGDRRRGRVGVWRPHLESISEASSEV